MSAIQQSAFTPVTAYDAPNVLFTQLLEDEATFESFLDTFLDDSQLTPKQRDSYVDRLKADYGGGNKAQEALIGVATNPLVLLGFLISPQIGRNLANKGQAFQHFLKGADGLSFMSLKNFKQMFQNTPLDPALRQIANSVRRSNRIFDDIMVPAEEKFIKQFGISRNQFHDTASITDKGVRARVERFKRMMVVDMDGQLLGATEDRSAVFKDMAVNFVDSAGNTRTITINQNLLADAAEKGYISMHERKVLMKYQAYINSDDVARSVEAVNENVLQRAGALDSVKFGKAGARDPIESGLVSGGKASKEVRKQPSIYSTAAAKKPVDAKIKFLGETLETKAIKTFSLGSSKDSHEEQVI